MVDKIFVKPDEVRGLGNIVSPSKTLEDFSVYGCSLSFEDDVYTMAYNSNERVFLWTPSGDYNYGEQIELSASISSQVAGLTMQFFDGETLIAEGVTDANGEASQYITSLSLGSHTITAKCKGITSTGSAVVNIVAEFDGFEIIETSNKTILSAYDEDVAVFHVQLTLDGEPVAKQGVSVNWYKDNVLVSTKSTMSSGWCEFGYDAVGAGDITFSAEVNVNGRLVSVTYSISDIYYYDSLTVDKQRYTTVSGSPTLTYSSNGLNVNSSVASVGLVKNNFLTLPSDYEAEITVTYAPQSSACGGLCFDDWLYDAGSAGQYYGSTYKLSNTSRLSANIRRFITDEVIKIVKNGTSLSLYINDTHILTNTISDDNHLQQFRTYQNRSTTFKDLKIREL